MHKDKQEKTSKRSSINKRTSTGPNIQKHRHTEKHMHTDELTKGHPIKGNIVKLLTSWQIQILALVF